MTQRDITKTEVIARDCLRLLCEIKMLSESKGDSFRNLLLDTLHKDGQMFGTKRKFMNYKNSQGYEVLTINGKSSEFLSDTARRLKVNILRCNADKKWSKKDFISISSEYGIRVDTVKKLKYIYQLSRHELYQNIIDQKMSLYKAHCLCVEMKRNKGVNHANKN